MDLIEKFVKRIPPDRRSNIPFFDSMREVYLNKYNKSSLYDNEIKKLKNSHQGERCFVIGTGPSLKKTPLELLKNEIVFGSNTLYKLAESRDFPITYYCVSDQGVWNTHKEGILKLNTTFFLSGYAGREYISNFEEYEKLKKEVIVFKDLGNIRRFGWKIKDVVKGTYWGNSIMVDLCLQLTFFMGFDEVYLLGVDFDYSKDHHFDGEKFKFQNKTDTYLEKHWERVYKSLEIIKEGYDSENRKIYNSTVGGKLDLFERKKLEEIL